jgi:hypothetical protein
MATLLDQSSSLASCSSCKLDAKTSLLDEIVDKKFALGVRAIPVQLDYASMPYFCQLGSQHEMLFNQYNLHQSAAV